MIFVFLLPPAKSTSSLCSSSGVVLSDLETVQLVAAFLHYRFLSISFYFTVNFNTSCQYSLMHSSYFSQSASNTLGALTILLVKYPNLAEGLAPIIHFIFDLKFCWFHIFAFSGFFFESLSV